MLWNWWPPLDALPGCNRKTLFEAWRPHRQVLLNAMVWRWSLWVNVLRRWQLLQPAGGHASGVSSFMSVSRSCLAEIASARRRWSRKWLGPNIIFLSFFASLFLGTPGEAKNGFNLWSLITGSIFCSLFWRRAGAGFLGLERFLSFASTWTWAWTSMDQFGWDCGCHGISFCSRYGGFQKKVALRKSSAAESEPLQSALDDDACLLVDSWQRCAKGSSTIRYFQPEVHLCKDVARHGSGARWSYFFSDASLLGWLERCSFRFWPVWLKLFRNIDQNFSQSLHWIVAKCIWLPNS